MSKTDANDRQPSRTRRLSSGITDGGLTKGLWKLALPMVLTGALHDLFTLTDLWFVSKLGDVSVAALTVCGTILSIVIMLVMGIGTGATALVAHFVGKREYENADNVAFQVLVLGAAGAVPMLLLALFATRGLIGLFGVDAQVIAAATGYLKISLAFSIFMFVSVGLSQALYGAGDAVTPFRMLLFTNAVNIALDPLLIFGVGPFPRLGIAGSAVATVASRGLMTVLLLWHLSFGHSALHLRRPAFRLNFPIMGRILSIGVFASVQVFIRQISFLVLMRLVASFGTATLAAYGIANRLRFVVMVPGFGLSNAAAVMVGQNMGAGKPDRATRAGWQTVKHYQMFAIPAALLYIGLAPHLISVFTDTQEVIGIGATYLRFLGVTFPFVACSIVLSRAMSGAGDTFAPAVMTAIGQWGLRIPAACLLALALKLGPMGIWLAINSSDVAQAVLFVLYFRSGVWQKRYRRHRARLEKRL